MKDFATPLLDALRSKKLVQESWECCLVSAIYPECKDIKDIPAEFMPKRWAGFVVTVYDKITNLTPRVARFAAATRNIRYMYTLEFNKEFTEKLKALIPAPESSFFGQFLAGKDNPLPMYSYWADHSAANLPRAANMIWDELCTILENANAQASS